MAVKIVTLRNRKVVAKKFIKALKKIISYKPNARIGLIWDDSLAPIYELVIKSKRLKWDNVKIFSLVEYKDIQSVTFENTLYTEFINKLHSVTRQNYESLRERIDELRSEDKLNDLYKFDGLVDLMVFPIDKRGNFLFNDFESKICYINYGNNGNEIITPGIKSLMFSKQVICFALEEDSEKIVNILNSKTISSNDFVSLLNVHDNITLFTLYSIIRKKEINKDNYVHDPESLSNKVLSTTYEGDMISDSSENVDNEKISDLTKDEFKDNHLLLIDDEDDEDDDEDEDINIELSDKETELESENLIDNSFDDGMPIDEPLNNDKDNLDDVLKEVISNNDQEPTQEELDQIELDQEYLYDAINESSTNEDDSLLDSVSESQFDLSSRDDADKYIEDDQVETIIGNREVESALYNNEELDDNIINQIKEMDKLKDDEVFLQEHPGSIDNEIHELQLIKKQLEDELAMMENQNKFGNLESNENVIVDLEPENNQDFNDVFNDELSKIGDEYTNKHDTLVLYEDEQEKVEVIDEQQNTNLFYDDTKLNSFVEDNQKENKDSSIHLESTFGNFKPEYVSIEGKTPEEIKKIISIKEDALRTIELLIKNNSLSIQQTKQEFKSDQSLVDELSNHNYIKIAYQPSERPVPLLMVYNVPDEQEYENTVLRMIQVFKSNMNARLFNRKNNHFWNMGAYVSMNKKTNELELCAFSDISNLVFLLRYINKDVHFYLSKANYNLIKDELDKFFGEFLVENID